MTRGSPIRMMPRSVARAEMSFARSLFGQTAQYRRNWAPLWQSAGAEGWVGLCSHLRASRDPSPSLAWVSGRGTAFSAL